MLQTKPHAPDSTAQSLHTRDSLLRASTQRSGTESTTGSARQCEMNRDLHGSRCGRALVRIRWRKDQVQHRHDLHALSSCCAVSGERPTWERCSRAATLPSAGSARTDPSHRQHSPGQSVGRGADVGQPCLRDDQRRADRAAASRLGPVAQRAQLQQAEAAIIAAQCLRAAAHSVSAHRLAAARLVRSCCAAPS